MFDVQGIEKQNYEVKINVEWTIEDDPIDESELLDEYTKNPNLCNSQDESLTNEKDSGYRGC